MSVSLHPEKRPNVLWIFGDQMRAQAMGCAGDQNVHTPNLDMLSQIGVTIAGGGISVCPLCCPARGSLLTGRYPHQAVPAHEAQLDPNQETVAQVLSRAGYQTAWFGKWHLDGAKEAVEDAGIHYIPPERRGGFDTWIGYENNNSQYNTHVHGHKAGEGEVGMYRLPGYETDALTDLLLQHLKDGATDRPFFAVLSVQPPHDPHIAPPSDMARHTPATYRLRHNVPPIAAIEEQAKLSGAGYSAQIENLDANIGRILDYLEESGLAENTHILFFSDHGEMLGSHGHFRKMTPYEESIRVPMFFTSGRRTIYSRHLKAGRSTLPVSLMDIPPTTLGLCGVPVPQYMRGHNLAHLRIPGLAGEEPDAALIMAPVPTHHGESVDKPWRGIITADGWKYTCLPGCEWMLFNLSEDPYELRNLAHEPMFRAKRVALLARLAEMLKAEADDFPLPAL